MASLKESTCQKFSPWGLLLGKGGGGGGGVDFATIGPKRYKKLTYFFLSLMG